MKKNLFEMGAKFEDGWSSDNKIKKRVEKREVKRAKEHKLHFSKEKRRGKIVTVIEPFFLEDKELKELLKELKSKIGCGGTTKDNYIELQGDVEQKAKAILISKEYKIK